MGVLNMDCVTGMRMLPDNSFDSIITDPPYELGFMGKSWDATGIAYSVEMWREALRVLKPGGHLLAFSGSRTYHRMTCAIEDAGFEIRDQIMWVYGSGFPKSLDVSKAIDKAAGAEREVIGERKKLQSYGQDANNVFGGGPDKGGVQAITAPATDAARQWEGWGTALKPAHEPIVVARKPLIGTVAANVLAHGTGALNIDGCRVPHGDALRAGAGGMPRHDEAVPRGRAGQDSATTRYAENGGTNFAALPGPRGGAPDGRWPANLIHDGSDEVRDAFPLAGGQQGALTGDEPSNCYGAMDRRHAAEPRREGDKSAARFFYCAKASRADRSESNTHPTVKPHELMRYLCRLVTPPGGRVLDPFAGSGSTGKAARREGFGFLGFELSPEYTAIANARIGAA